MKRRHRKVLERTPRAPAHIRPQLGPKPSSSYPEPIDAVVLAGAQNNPREMIRGSNKAFLPFHGMTLVERVVRTLTRCPSLDRIFVVGPVDRLGQVLPERSTRVRLVEQKGKMIGNAWEGFQASERLRSGGLAAERDRPVLFTSCDLPLISVDAVEDFVARCADADARTAGDPTALHVGVAEEASLAPYYPSGDRPGIARPYVELRSGRYRLANIYVGRPHRMGHREILQAGFSRRKAKDWQNVLGLSWTFFRQGGGWRAAHLVLHLQMARMALGWSDRLYRWLRRRTTREQMEAVGTLLLGGRFRLVDTPYGGLSLDVDDAHDYEVLLQRFGEWALDHAATGARLA